MTKQFKKGLVAVLIVLMAVLVGFTSNAVIGQSRAADPSQDQIEAFEKQVRVLQAQNLTDAQIADAKYLLTGILGEKTTEKEPKIKPFGTTYTGGSEYEQVKFKDVKKATTVWSAYNAAKTQIPELTKFARIDDIDKDLLALYRKYDETLSNVNAYRELIRFTSTMKAIADGFDPYTTYKASHGLVEQMTTDIEGWIKEGLAYEASLDTSAKTNESTLHYYLYYSSGVEEHYHEYFRALKRMNDMEAQFADIDKAIDAIKYYDEDAKTMKGDSEADDDYSADKESEGVQPAPEGKKQTIVESSRASVKVVTDKLFKTVEQKTTNLVDPADYEFIKGKKDYDKAVERLEYWTSLKKEVEDLIEDAFSKKVDGKVYFTIRDLIQKANNKCNELLNASRYEGGVETAQNYNNLKDTLDPTIKGHLDTMNAYLETLYDKIDAVVALIKLIPELDAASYTEEYRKTIEDAEKAFAALDKDISNGISDKFNDAEYKNEYSGFDAKGRDVAIYPLVKENRELLAEQAELNAANAELQKAIDAINAKRKAPDYKEAEDKTKDADDTTLRVNAEKIQTNNATLTANSARLMEIAQELLKDDHYMFGYDEFIVEGFDKLMAAREQLDSWTKIIKDRMARVEKLIELYENGQSADQEEGLEGFAAILNELRPMYEDKSGKYWFGADPMAHKNAFLYAAKDEYSEQIFVHDEKTEDIFGKYMDRYNFLITDSKYPPNHAEGPVTNYDVLSYFYYLWDRIQEAVGDVDERIKNLHDAATKAGCVYGYRGELVDLYTEFKKFKDYKLDGTTGEGQDYTDWISGKNMLLDMYDEYQEEEKLVQAWAALAENLKVPVSVADFEQIEAAKEAFKAIKHYVKPAEPAANAEVNYGTFLAQTGDGKWVYKTMEDDEKYEAEFPNLKLDYSAEYAKYSAAVTAKDALAKQIKDLSDEMAAIVTDAKKGDKAPWNKDWDINPADGKVDLDKTIEWTNLVKEIIEKYKAIADKVLGGADGKTEVNNIEGNISYVGAQDYLQKTYAEAYANYLKALQLIRIYEVEAAIEKLPDPEDITHADYHHVQDAWELHNLYLRDFYDYNDAECIDPNTSKTDGKKEHEDFRNDKKLHDCMDKIGVISEDLVDWERKVVQLYEDIDDEAVASEVNKALDRAKKDFVDKNGVKYPNGFPGYPLDLEKWAEVGAAYEDLIDVDEPEKSARVEYLEKAKGVYDYLNQKSDEVINKLNDDIAKWAADIEANGYTADNTAAVEDIYELYNKLHKTQQDRVNLQDIADAKDMLDAMAAFKGLVTELYREVVQEKNITSFVQYYIDTARVMYNTFPTDIRLSFSDSNSANCIKCDKYVGYAAVLEAIQAAYDENGGDKGADHLNKIKEAFEKAQQELIDELKNAFSVEAEIANGEPDPETKSALQEALEAFKNNITTAYQNYVDEKFGELDDRIKNLEDASKTPGTDNSKEIEDLTAQLNALKATLEHNGMTDQTNFAESLKKLDQLDTLDATIDSKINAAITALQGTIKDQLDALETELRGLIDAKADKTGSSELDDAIADLEAQIAAAKKEVSDAVDGKITDITDRLEALSGVSSNLSKLTSDLDQVKKDINDLKAADEDLQKQISSLKSTSTTLTVLVIILAVMVLAALACIVLLFIRRK